MKHINDNLLEAVEEVSNLQYTLENLHIRLSKLKDKENYVENINKMLQNIEKLSLRPILEPIDKVKLTKLRKEFAKGSCYLCGGNVAEDFTVDLNKLANLTILDETTDGLYTFFKIKGRGTLKIPRNCGTCAKQQIQDYLYLQEQLDVLNQRVTYNV